MFSYVKLYYPNWNKKTCFLKIWMITMMSIPILLQVSVSDSCCGSMGLTLILCFLLIILFVGMC